LSRVQTLNPLDPAESWDHDRRKNDMKKLILASLALLLVAAGPAMAGEFQALSKLSVPGQTALKSMTDNQLAAVEGQGRRGRHGRVNINVQVAVLEQINVCVLCVAIGEGASNQTNAAAIIQAASNNN
jgi:hypothetical protein